MNRPIQYFYKGVVIVKKNNYLFVLLILITALVPIVSVNAANNYLGSLTHWHAMEYNEHPIYGGWYNWNEIARWNNAPYAIAEHKNGFNYTDFISYYSYALNKWRDEDITIHNTSDDSIANFTVNGGTETTIRNLEPSIPDGATGFVNWYDSTYVGYYLHGGESKHLLIQNSIDIYIIYDSTYNLTNNRSLLLHEFGHGLGYRGHAHPSYSSDLMHQTAYPTVTNITNRDREHLLQVY